MRYHRPYLFPLVALALAGCPTDPVVPADAGTDAPALVDAGRDAPATTDVPVMTDTGVDGGPPVSFEDASIDAPVDAPVPSADGGPPPLPAITTPAPHTVPFSATDHDRLYAVVSAPDSSFYAVGQAVSAANRTCVGGTAAGTTCTASATCTGGGTCPEHDARTIVAHFTSAGELDTSFGGDGWVEHNLVVAGSAELARGIGLQSDGSIVISATVEHLGGDPRDRDVAIARLTPAGALDTTFDTDGIVIDDVSAGEVVGTGYVADGSWNLVIDSTDRIILAVAPKRTGGTDTDWGIVRLTPAGARDLTFSGDGLYTLDLDNRSVSVREVSLVPGPGGMIAGAGYYSAPITYPGEVMERSVARPVIYLVDGAGAPVTTFGTNGVYTEVVLDRQVEAYGATAVGMNFVTAGYGGPRTPTQNDFISLRIGPTGVRDLTYGTGSGPRACAGGTAPGLLCTDATVCVGGGTCPTGGISLLSGFNYGDNARAGVAMPDGSVMLIGRLQTDDAVTPRICVGGTAPAGTTCTEATVATDCPGTGATCPIRTRYEAAILLLDDDGIPEASFGTAGVHRHDFGGGGATVNADVDQWHGGVVETRDERVMIVGIANTTPLADDDASIYLLPVP